MAEQSFEKKLWGDLYLLVHNLRVDIQQNPVVSARMENKLQREFTDSALAAATKAHNADKQAYALEVLENAKALVLKDRTIFMTHKDVATMDEWMKTRQNLRREISAAIDQAIAKVKGTQE